MNSHVDLQVSLCRAWLMFAFCVALTVIQFLVGSRSALFLHSVFIRQQFVHLPGGTPKRRQCFIVSWSWNDFSCLCLTRSFITMLTNAHYLTIPWHSWHQMYFLTPEFINEICWSMFLHMLCCGVFISPKLPLPHMFPNRNFIQL
jgi:hypothetical protein